MAKRKPLVEEFGQLLKRKPKSVRETIYKVRQILLDKKHWVKHENLSLTNGDGCGEHEATRCCIYGALQLVGGRFEERANERILKIVDREFRGKRETDSLEEFNDDARTKHHDVVHALNDAFEVR